jgi:hypothetical protein
MIWTAVIIAVLVFFPSLYFWISGKTSKLTQKVAVTQKAVDLNALTNTANRGE